MLGVESLDRQTGGVGGEWCSLKLHHYKFFRDVWQFIGWLSGRDHFSEGRRLLLRVLLLGGLRQIVLHDA